MACCTNVEIALMLLAAGAVVACFIRGWRAAGWLATLLVAAAAALAWKDGLGVLLSGETLHGRAVQLPRFGSEFAVSLDPLGAGFLLLVTAVAFVSTLYSIDYMALYSRERPRRFYSMLLVFIAGMMGVVVVADWLFFIVCWELMTLASYFLVTFEREDPAAIRAGFKYFVMTHIGTAGLLITAVVMWANTGSFAFEDHKAGLMSLAPQLKHLLLALYLLAFSTKAGILPMGDWLPDAHPAAPSGISALLSGVMIKLGVYGVLRVFWGLFPSYGTRAEATAWGVVIAGLGTLSAFVGGVTAMKESDSKRLLAFSSISQSGYIYLALGIGLTFASSSEYAVIALLGLLGAGFHILNDALYKSLLFMTAGSVLYATGTRDLNKVGGLYSVMPIAATAALVGVLSLSGLPPTNGFASKWIIYQASISGGLRFAPFVVAAVAAFFVSLSTLAYSFKFFSSAFLGKLAAGMGEAKPLPITMTIAQAIPALACLAIGLSPFWAIRIIGSIFHEGVSDAFTVGRFGDLTSTAAFGGVTAYWSPLAIVAALAICFVGAEIIRASGRAKARAVPTWYCGEEHSDDEVRYRAQGLYSPFNEAFEKVYFHVPLPRLPILKRLRNLLDFDALLYDRVVHRGGQAVDRVSRSHVGVPQLYMIWQVAGMIVVLALLFATVR